jgi:predicted transcriptional regulator
MKRAVQQRNQITDVAKQRSDGITCDEAEQLLGMLHQSCSARFNELERDGILIPSETTRRTRSGSSARVMLYGKPKGD